MSQVKVCPWLMYLHELKKAIHVGVEVLPGLGCYKQKPLGMIFEHSEICEAVNCVHVVEAK